MSLLTPVASLDLHGCRLEHAMYKVTRFLESSVVQNNNNNNNNNITNEKKVWVRIITGSGSHSQDGPVLREAVRSLLTRREMEYILQRGKGAFLVNANSGHELVGTATTKTTRAMVPAVDSKVIVTSEFCDTVRHKNVVVLVRRQPSGQSSSSRTTPHGVVQLACTTTPPLWTPAEVAADDDLLERIKTTSAQEHMQSIREEQRELNRAISISKQKVDRRRLQQQQEQDEQFEAILQQSQYEQSLRHGEEEKRALMAESRLSYQEEDEIIQRRANDKLKRDEEERLAAALWESSHDEENVVREKELALQLERAISISQLEIISQHHNNDDDDDDKALHEALAQSMHDMNAVDSQLNQVLEMSLREETMNEDDLIHQALLLSLNETIDTVANVDERERETIKYSF